MTTLAADNTKCPAWCAGHRSDDTSHVVDFLTENDTVSIVQHVDDGQWLVEVDTSPRVYVSAAEYLSAGDARRVAVALQAAADQLDAIAGGAR